MKDEQVKVSANRQKKEAIVTELSEKFGKANAVVFTNYQGLTHKQLETFKRAIKPLKAEFVVAKNSLLTIALTENKLKLEVGQVLDGQTGTLFLYEDIISPLKALAKTIKELNLPGVKFGIMDKNPITGEQVLKLSTLPTREVLLSQLVGTLKGPIFGLHRALNWNLQKLVLTLNAVAKSKPATAAVVTPEPVTAKSPVEGTEPESIMAETKMEVAAEVPSEPSETPQVPAKPNITEPETIMAETKAEVEAERPSEAQSSEGTEEANPTLEAENNKKDDEGGEN
jgi:large subunit ribosomal protein L10